MSLASHWLTHDDTCIHILARGASLRVWQVAGENAILGYEDPAAYATNPYYLGALVGRVANRIAGATFPLAGEEVRIPPNEGSNLLHGGADGLSSRLFKLIPNGPRHARLTYTSPPGEGGFPGQAAITVDLHLENRTLFYAITATVDRPTPISIAQHVYYALGGAPVLTLPARRYLPVDADGMPDRPMPLRSSLIDGLRLDATWDHTVIPETLPTQTTARGSRFTLSLVSDQPGIQVYTTDHLRPLHTPLAGQTHGPRSALCLEPQGWPNAVNRPDFPSVIATPERPYRQNLSVTIYPSA